MAERPIACATTDCPLADLCRRKVAPDTAVTQWANAHLFASAPALLQVLSDLVEASAAEANEKGAGGYLLARLSDARTAIAKATGVDRG